MSYMYKNKATSDHLMSILLSTIYRLKFNFLMGRQSEPAVHSSIALLQERFRRLQRAKELRQEREVLRLLSEAERINQGTPNEASQLFFHSELILQPRPPLQGSVHSESSMQNRRQVIETPILSNLQQRDMVLHTSTFSDSDVDTSLHL